MLVPLKHGFTLIETLIYIALLSSFFTMCLWITEPLMRTSQIETDSASTEYNALFIMSKIRYALRHFATTSAAVAAITPGLHTSSSTFSLTLNGTNLFLFTASGSDIFYGESTSGVEPLNSTRDRITHFLVMHERNEKGEDYLTISFDANDTPIGPMRYTFPFSHSP